MTTLIEELASDALGRGYSTMTDEQRLVSLHVVDRPGPGDPLALFNYFTNTRFRTNTGADLDLSVLYGRLALCAGAAVGANVLGATPVVSLSLSRKASCIAFKAILDAQTTGAEIDFSDTGNTFNDLLGDMISVHAISNGNRTAIRALSENKQNRAQELGFPNILLGDVVAARTA